MFEFWNSFLSLYNSAYSYLIDLINRLDAITFEEYDLLYKFFAAIRYIVGSEVYLLLSSILLIVLGIVIYKLILKAWSFVVSFGRSS